MSTNPWTIPADDLELPEDAHKGGRIAQGVWKGKAVVVKVLSKQAEAELLYERAELWTSLQHDNVLQTLGLSPADADPLYTVTPHQTNGNVMAYLKQNSAVDRAKIVRGTVSTSVSLLTLSGKQVYDVVLGMQYLHSRGVVHGSLKPVNILIGLDGSACVSDYGMVEVQTSGSYGHRYFSPEAWKGTVSRSSDVYAWAMSALEIYTSTPPWGILTEKQIFRLVVQQDTRPDRPDEDFGLTDHTWSVMEECWSRVSRLRPTFDILSQLLRSHASTPPLAVVQRETRPQIDVTHSETFTSSMQPPHQDPDFFTTADSLASLNPHRNSYAASMMSVPPSYEASASSINPLLTPESAPPSLTNFIGPPAPPSPGAAKRAMMNAPYRPPPPPQQPNSPPPPISPPPPPPPPTAIPEHLQYLQPRTSDSSSASTSTDEDRLSPMFARSLSVSSSSTPPDTPSSPWTGERRLTPSSSVRTTSSGASSRSYRSSGSGSGTSRHVPERLHSIGTIGEEQAEPVAYVEPSPPLQTPRTSRMPPSVYSQATRTPNSRHTSAFPFQYSPGSIADREYHHAYAESVRSQPSTIGGTALNASLLAGALLTEVKEGRKREVIDEYLGKIYVIGLRSQKDVQQLVTAGLIPTLITLLKTRAVDGIGLEPVLFVLGLLSHDSITANTIFRTSSTATFIQILDAAQSDEIAALAVWCLTRIARSPEVASGLLKQNVAKILVNKGLKGGPRTSRISAWCIGALVRSDSIADTLADGGMANSLSEHLRRVQASVETGPDDCSSILYAVARLSRSIKIAKTLARGGTVEVLAHILLTGTEAQVLQFAARAVGCLMRPNSGDMARTLLDAGIARGLARLPSVLPPDQLDPLGALAFAVQRFSCAEWGGGTRKALVDAGVVDSLLAAIRTAADEDCPQVHIELAYAIALLSDVGGTAIRKEIVNAGGIDILKHIAASPTVKPEVAKACNLAVTSITGNVWSRNAASAKAAYAHEWSGGCPDFVPDCPVLALEDV
ncbi:Protein kinase domain-containing protein [Mycena indigotica]|uniref:Protein kinase domain-containing protein n=1 Tax=Mycena indigotica TaxID=2126181 RepID=A0A8H6VW96_9AGAR|nr:Protein kinase domain-containing protein [Mycena indigotica]KAF7290544.1 Protein kinase domain-containing protein [Mycena indigotica]